MIIDTHSHTPAYRDKIPISEITYATEWRPDRAVKTPVNWEEYLATRTPVDKSIVFKVAMKPGDRPNHATAEFVQTYPDQLVGFMSVHPYDPKCLLEIEDGVDKLGLKGIKLLPSYQNFNPLGKEAYRVYAAAAEMKLPILFHAGITVERFVPNEWGHPRVFDQIAMSFPDLKMILAHLAETVDTPSLAGMLIKHPNMYTDISALFYRKWSFYNCLRVVEEWGIAHKVFFASDYPVATPQETLDALMSINQMLEGTLLPRIGDQTIQAIIYKNSLSILGIE
jgi:predicted TIM-barrel fold metal-dependent hydrolase